MKIGIMTFHWGTNYGGVLQAYALQQFLKKNVPSGEVSIINYVPKTHSESFIKCVVTKNFKSIPGNLITYFKEKKFVDFRKKHLSTTERYYTLSELKSKYTDMDFYICGSDQVWNPYIIDSYGLPYFLPFGKKTTKRVSYAVSFGCTDYPSNKMDIIKPLIQEFNAISVRENTGVSILQNAGFDNVELMPDPTLLFEKKDLENITPAPTEDFTDEFVFSYSLQNDQTLIDKVNKYFRKSMKMVNTRDIKYAFLGIEDWLYNIKYAKFIITNSFHGVVFSILFQKQFIVIPIEGALSGMNDRIYTLLQKFDLKSRILDTYNEETLEKIISTPIDWQKVANTQESLKNEAYNFFKKMSMVK